MVGEESQPYRVASAVSKAKENAAQASAGSWSRVVVPYFGKFCAVALIHRPRSLLMVRRCFRSGTTADVGAILKYPLDTVVRCVKETQKAIERANHGG